MIVKLVKEGELIQESCQRSHLETHGRLNLIKALFTLLFWLPFVPLIRCCLYFLLKESKTELAPISAGIEFHVLTPAYVIQFCDTSSLL